MCVYLQPKPQPLSSSVTAAEEHLKVEASWKIPNFGSESDNLENMRYYEEHLGDKETFYLTNIYFRNFPIVFKFPELQVCTLHNLRSLLSITDSLKPISAGGGFL